MKSTHRQRQGSSLRLRTKEPYKYKTKEPYTSAKRAQWARKRALCVCKRPMKCTNRLKLESGLCLRDKSPVYRAKRALCVCKRALWPQKSPVFLHQTCEKHTPSKTRVLACKRITKSHIYCDWALYTLHSIYCDCITKSHKYIRQKSPMSPQKSPTFLPKTNEKHTPSETRV